SEFGALVAEHPLRERLYQLLMVALYRCGRQFEALAVYQTARLALVDELGIEPSPALQRVERAILARMGPLTPRHAWPWPPRQGRSAMGASHGPAPSGGPACRPPSGRAWP